MALSLCDDRAQLASIGHCIEPHHLSIAHLRALELSRHAIESKLSATYGQEEGLEGINEVQIGGLAVGGDGNMELGLHEV